ncbi:hypothetical protein ACWDYH_13850 [Nocardia goodfellowii]
MTRPAAGTASLHRQHARQRSAAPHYVGLTALAHRKQIPPTILVRWRREGPIWVPGEEIHLGTDPGWSLPRADAWTPDSAPSTPPTPVVYWPEAEMMRHYRISLGTLWALVVADRRLPMPAIWLDGRPGWEPGR